MSAPDYCTLSPEGWWGHCCKQHDDDYLHQIGQAKADAKLGICIMQSRPGAAFDDPVTAAGAAGVALAAGCIYWAAVRLFGRCWYGPGKRKD